MLLPDTSECRVANEQHAQVGAYEVSLRLEARESRQAAVLLRQHMRLLDDNARRCGYPQHGGRYAPMYELD